MRNYIIKKGEYSHRTSTVLEIDGFELEVYKNENNLLAWLSHQDIAVKSGLYNIPIENIISGISEELNDQELIDVFIASIIDTHVLEAAIKGYKHKYMNEKENETNTRFS